jgi:glycosyltransferase involved in cell wall biosynthesis
MKLLFVLTPAFNPNNGGVQRTTYKLGKHFTEKGIEVFYFSTAFAGHIDVEYGILYHGQEKGGCRNDANLKYLLTVLGEVKPDIVINQMPYEAELRSVLSVNRSKLGYILLGCLRNSLFSFKSNARDIVRTMYHPLLFKALNNRIALGLIQLNHRRTHARDLRHILDDHDKFILLTPRNNDELSFFVGDYQKEKVLSIPNSIPEVFTQFSHKEKTILYVGRLNIQQKKADIILPVWERIYQKLPDWKLIIIGDGPFMGNMKTNIEKHKLERVSLTGYQKPESYYKDASIFLMPSAYEGFPNVIIEAQSFGLVPVAFDSYAAVNWIVNNNIDAFLVPPYKVDQMAEAVLKLASDETLLAEMRNKAFGNASRFTIDNVGAIWIELFKNLGKYP